MKKQRLLVGVYIVVIVLAAAAAFVTSTKKNGIFACQPVADDNRKFIAYCNASSYADFDHGAFYFGLRPDTMAAAANADVLFLGNSRLQFAYSTDALQRLFDARSLTYYLLGFSHGENQAFSREILDLISPSAGVYVIGVDDFFETTLTDPARDVLTNPEARNRYRQKQQWQALHSQICGSWPDVCGHEYAYIRSIDNGHWRFEGRNFLTQVPSRATAVENKPGVNEEKLAAYLPVAEAFTDRLQATGACVILTNAPNSSVSHDTAQRLAANLNLPFVTADIAGLTTFDGSHLERPSAERWVEALSAELGESIDSCGTPVN